MQNNKNKAIGIYRQLTPNNRANLLSLVRLAYLAENSARKNLGIDAVVNGVSISKPREYSGGNLVKRSKK